MLNNGLITYLISTIVDATAITNANVGLITYLISTIVDRVGISCLWLFNNSINFYSM